MSEPLPIQTVPFPPETAFRWEEERIFVSCDEFFAGLLDEISRSEESLYLEYYIFELDVLGHRMLEAVKKAAARGVRVRILVDGVGSPSWNQDLLGELREAGVEARIYKPYPWVQKGFRGLLKFFHWRRLMERLRIINRRDHRKVTLIDGKAAWLGSLNVSVCHLEEFSGKEAWRDTSVRVAGAEVEKIALAFEKTWKKAWGLKEPERKRWFFRRTGKTSLPFYTSDALVRLNHLPLLRERFYWDFLQRVRNSKRVVWITMGYFIPRRSLNRALRKAASRGGDVRVLIPRKTDVLFTRWVTAALLHKLLKVGVRVFEYLPRILHAKIVQVDDWAMIGSSNLNYRSFLHDLELDVVVRDPESIRTLEREYREDLSFSEEITLERWQKGFWIEKFLGRILLFLRYWF